MSDQTKSFSEIAQGLARNPLGIIALFIVLVYGFASLVTAFAGSFSSAERLPLIYFLVVFPVLVLLVFAWLVSGHSAKLLPALYIQPRDFKDEENYVKGLSAAASLAVASTKNDTNASESDIEAIVESIREVTPTQKALSTDRSRNHVLWVDDRPDNNVHERQAFEAMGLRFTLALSTQEALEKVTKQRFAAIISDMGRKEGPREGYVLLDAVREQGNQTPFFIYAGSNDPEHEKETLEHGGQGCTNRAQELFQMVTRAVISG